MATQRFLNLNPDPLLIIEVTDSLYEGNTTIKGAFIFRPGAENDKALQQLLQSPSKQKLLNDIGLQMRAEMEQDQDEVGKRDEYKIRFHQSDVTKDPSPKHILMHCMKWDLLAIAIPIAFIF
jgi:hypothetical protein